MNDIASRCIDIIAKSKNISPDTVTLATTFDELNVDSLDKINISFEVEEAFNIEIPDEALGSIKTVGDMVDGVTKLHSAKSRQPPHPPDHSSHLPVSRASLFICRSPCSSLRIALLLVLRQRSSFARRSAAPSLCHSVQPDVLFVILAPAFA